jgi:trimethylamine--corrinoid protein Co-methyltransferase
MGIAGVDQASSLDMLVFQDEVIAFVESTLRALDFSEEAFALEEVAQVGPGGSYIGTDHTAREFRRALWFPRLFDRGYYEAWLTAGAETLEERACRRAQELLATHEVDPLDEATDQRIGEVVAAARRALGGG